MYLMLEEIVVEIFFETLFKWNVCFFPMYGICEIHRCLRFQFNWIFGGKIDLFFVFSKKESDRQEGEQVWKGQLPPMKDDVTIKFSFFRILNTYYSVSIPCQVETPMGVDVVFGLSFLSPSFFPKKKIEWSHW